MLEFDLLKKQMLIPYLPHFKNQKFKLLDRIKHSNEEEEYKKKKKNIDEDQGINI